MHFPLARALRTPARIVCAPGWQQPGRRGSGLEPPEDRGCIQDCLLRAQGKSWRKIAREMECNARTARRAGLKGRSLILPDRVVRSGRLC
jgi:hypothetical protein